MTKQSQKGCNEIAGLATLPASALPRSFGSQSHYHSINNLEERLISVVLPLVGLSYIPSFDHPADRSLLP
jgi:hypothetical protein